MSDQKYKNKVNRVRFRDKVTDKSKSMDEMNRLNDPNVTYTRFSGNSFTTVDEYLNQLGPRSKSVTYV